jgi:hypothetical protein
MKLKVGGYPVVNLYVWGRHAHSAMLFLGQGCKIYFPVPVFYGFGIVCKKRRPGQSGKRHEGKSKTKGHKYQCDTAHTFPPL